MGIQNTIDEEKTIQNHTMRIQSTGVERKIQVAAIGIRHTAGMETANVTQQWGRRAAHASELTRFIKEQKIEQEPRRQSREDSHKGRAKQNQRLT